MGLQLVTAPTADPVTIEEAKAQCRVLHPDEDMLLAGLIAAATRHVEKVLDLSLMARTWRLTLDAFSPTIELPRGPVTSVTAVNYVDRGGLTQQVPTEKYTTDLASPAQWIVLNSGGEWPATIGGVNAVSIDYVAGFTSLPSTYDDLKHAILLLIGHWYANREAVNVGNITSEVPLAVASLIQPYQRFSV